MLYKCLLAFCPEIIWKSPWLQSDTFYVMEQVLYSWTVWGKLTGRGTHPSHAQPCKNCMLNFARVRLSLQLPALRVDEHPHTQRKQPFSSRKGTEQIAEGFYVTGKTIFQHHKFSVDQKILVTGDIARTLRKAEHEWDISCSKFCFGEQQLCSGLGGIAVLIWEQGRNLPQLPGLPPPVQKEYRKYGKP